MKKKGLTKIIAALAMLIMPLTVSAFPEMPAMEKQQDEIAKETSKPKVSVEGNKIVIHNAEPNSEVEIRTLTGNLIKKCDVTVANQSIELSSNEKKGVLLISIKSKNPSKSLTQKVFIK